MTGTDFSPAPTRAATDDSAGTSLEARLADRTRDLDELTRQHAATVEILDIIARSPAGLQPVLDAVVRAAVRHCGADDATMFLREGSEVFGAAHEGPLPSGLGARQQLGRSHIHVLIIRDGQTIHVPDTEALDPVDFASVIALARQRGVRALVGAPIRHAGEVIGYLLLRRREVGPFTARQIAMLETLATQAGIAVANAGVITELRQSLEQQTATAEVLQVINASPGDTTPVFETILQKTHALCGIAYGSLQLYDGQKFRAVATHNLPEPLAMRLREGYVPGPHHRQLIDGAGFSQFPDIGLVDDPMAKAAAEGGIKTLLCVPLRTDGRLLGQIVCVRKEVRPFTDREIALLQGFAAQAVIAMENARLIGETRESLEQQTATADILRVISQSPTDVGPVLRAVVSAALRFCGAEDAMVALRDGDESVTAAHEGPLGGVVGTRARLDPRGRGTVRAIVERRTIHVPDVAAPDQQEFAVSRDLAREQNFRAFVVTPLMRDGVAIGSIGLRRPNPGPFTPHQIALLESFAAQAVIAIENVRLFTELREALERQTAMAEVLAAINANPGELAPVFDAILEKAHRLCGSAVGNLSLYDGARLRRVAFRGMSGETSAMVAEPRNVSDLHGRLVRGERFVHVADLDAADAPRTESLTALREREGIRSFVLVPLRREGAFLGYISANWAEPRSNVASEVALLESFAAQAVIAIENARLITETREALERQTAMAEVLAAINASPGDLTPVFSTILDKALSLSGSSLGFLMRFDGEKFWLVAGRNTPPAVRDIALRGHMPEAGTLLHRLVLGDDVASLADIRDDEAYRAGAPSRVILADEGGARSQLIVALRKDGRLLGCIQIYRSEVRAFSEAEIALVRSFADQAVIAMENARLLTETREALEQQTATAEVLATINANPGALGPVFDAMLKKAMLLCGATVGELRTYDGQDFRQVASRGMPDAYVDHYRRRSVGYGPGTGPARIVAGEPLVHIPDLIDTDAYRRGDPDRVALVELGGARASLIAPLLRGRELAGLIMLLREQPGPFGDRQIALLQNFAAQAVIAIENARLITETREALERQTAMAEVLAAINANPGELTPVFDAILDKALSLSGSSYGILDRFDGEKFWQVAGRNIPPAAADIVLRGYVPDAGTLLHRLVLGDDVGSLADIRDDEAYRAGVPSRVVLADVGGARSLLTVALRKDGRLLGCFTFYRTEVRAFSKTEVTLVRAFADQAVIAMENARLITETREALERQTATAEVLQVINASPGDLEPVFEIILAKAHDLCGATLGSLNLFDGGMNRAVATRGMDDAFSDFLRRGTPMSGVLSREHTVQVADLADHARQNPDNPVWRAATELGRVRTMLGVPLVKDGNVLGRIIAARREVRPFTESQIALLENFAAQAVIAMENARLLGQIRQRQAELRVTFDNMGDGVAMFDAELRLAAWNRNFERIIGVPEDRLADRPSYAQYLLLLAERGEFGTENVEAELAGRLEDTERELRLERTRADGTVIEVRRNAVPGGGFVLIYSDITQRRKAEAAIREARDAAEAALERQTATSEILHIISQSPTTVQPVFDFVVRAAVRLCGARDAIVVMRDGPEVVFEAHEGPVGGDRGARWPLDRDNAMGRAIIESRTVHIPDTTALGPGEFAGTQHGMTLYGFKAIVAAPLMREGGAIGALLLRKPEPGPFTPRQIELLESFAAQAVIAIENVRLFNETKEALERQTATAEILSVISRSPTDVQPVFDAIAQSALRLLNGWSVLVWRYDGERMRIIASHGGVPGTDATSVRAALGEPRPEDLAYPGDAILKRAILQIADVEAAGVPEGVREVAHARGWRANIAVPMLHDGAPIGIITVSRKVPGAFAEREIGLLQTFAAQAVIAIQNVRLFNETKEALERQTATAEILSVISRSPTDVQPVFDAIVRRAAPLGNGLHAAFYRYDGALQHLVAHNNAGDEKFAELIATLGTIYPRAPQRSTATGTALLDGAAVHVPNMQGDRRFTGGGHSASLAAGYRSSLAVPLLKEGQAIGVIYVVRREAGLFSPEHIALLESFANQAVIAIENVRLFTELRDSLERLKAAQTNLIQAEKLASLGQLTAGIAHEIKNPLNFVNNFADLSAELVGELREALDPARTELGAKARADVDELTEMLTANLAKVSQHGRRADSIVKNMLLHSREGGGERRRIDLNASVEESLNLAYHGARAEKPGFNVTLEKDLDPAVGEVELYPQEFVRALLNLISNGFYAAHQRKIASADATFEPTLRVTTRALGDRAEIRIRDNGTGIPDAVKEKIFNPFFTTKPAGEGTGLGLSLSFDIVVKQHGGTIDVETEPGVFTEFILTVPRQLAADAAPATVRLP